MSRKDSHHHGNLSCSLCGKGQREVRTATPSKGLKALVAAL